MSRLGKLQPLKIGARMIKIMSIRYGIRVGLLMQCATIGSMSLGVPSKAFGQLLATNSWNSARLQSAEKPWWKSGEALVETLFR